MASGQALFPWAVERYVLKKGREMGWEDTAQIHNLKEKKQTEG